MIAIWNWLNNKKTLIGILAKALLKMAGQVKPEMQSTFDSLDEYVNMWIAVGVADKMRKMQVK